MVSKSFLSSSSPSRLAHLGRLPFLDRHHPEVRLQRAVAVKHIGMYITPSASFFWISLSHPSAASARSFESSAFVGRFPETQVLKIASFSPVLYHADSQSLLVAHFQETRLDRSYQSIWICLVRCLLERLLALFAHTLPKPAHRRAQNVASFFPWQQPAAISCEATRARLLLPFIRRPVVLAITWFSFWAC